MDRAVGLFPAAPPGPGSGADLQQVLGVVILAGMVDLEGGVGDAVALAQQTLQVATFLVALATGEDQDVCGQGALAGGDLPDVQVVDLGDVQGAARCPPTRSGSIPVGAASRKMREEARTSPIPNLSMSATTTSEAIASARANPVASKIAPAIAVAMNA